MESMRGQEVSKAEEKPGTFVNDAPRQSLTIPPGFKDRQGIEDLDTADARSVRLTGLKGEFKSQIVSMRLDPLSGLAPARVGECFLK